MQVAFTTYSTPRWTLAEIAEQASALGFEAVELRMYEGHEVPADLSPADCRRVRGIFAARGLGLCALGCSCRLSGDAAVRHGQLELARRYLGIAAALGAPVLRLFGGVPPAAVTMEEACARVADGLSQLCPAAQAAGVRLALETHDAFAAATLVGAVLAQVPDPWVGACWDWLHPIRVGESVQTTWRALEGRVLHVHTKDAARTEGGAWEARYFGEGELPLGELLTCLQRGGYSGALSLEWEPRGGDPHPEIALQRYVPVVRALLAARAG